MGEKKKPGPRHARIVVAEKKCSKCLETKPASEFYSHKTTRDSLNNWCKGCVRENSRRWVEQNKSRARESRRRYESKIPGYKARKALRGRLRQYGYGLTEEQYEGMLQRSGGLCMICGKACALEIDHDHTKHPLEGAPKTVLCTADAVRGLLCPTCNWWLMVVDAPGFLEKADAYLKRYAVDGSPSRL